MPTNAYAISLVYYPPRPAAHRAGPSVVASTLPSTIAAGGAPRANSGRDRQSATSTRSLPGPNMPNTATARIQPISGAAATSSLVDSRPATLTSHGGGSAATSALTGTGMPPSA